MIPAAANSTDSGDVSCPSDVTHLSADIDGPAFCSAYISYVPPVSTALATYTPATSVVTSTRTDFTTKIVYTTSYSTSLTLTTTTVTAMQKRALQTPASAISWSPSRLSKACSGVATGSTTTTLTQTAATPLSTLVTTQRVTTSSTVSTAVVVTSTSTIVAKVSPFGPNLVSSPGFEKVYIINTTPKPSGWYTANQTPNSNGLTNNWYPSAAYSGSAYGILFTSKGSSGILEQTQDGPSNTCKLVVSLGGIVVYSALSPKAIPSGTSGPQYYNSVSVPNISPAAAAQSLVFDFNCQPTAYVF